MPLVKRVDVTIKADGYEDTKLKIDRLRVASEELGKQHPEIQPRIEGQRALIEARLLRAAINRELSGSLDVGGSSGLFSKLGAQLKGFSPFSGGGGFGSGGMFSSLGSFGSSPAGIAAITASVGALLTETAGLVAGFTAAAAGIGAFGLVSAGTFSQLKQDVSQYQAAWDKLNQAQNVQAVDPTKSHLAAVQKAQVNLKATLMGMNEDAGSAAVGINQLRLAYDKLSASTAPLTFKVINDALKIANTLLPDLKPFAVAAGQAIDGLLGKANKFFQSADFKKWLGEFSKLVGPSITAIGEGIGKVTVAVGKLLTSMSAHDVVHAINIAFDTIAGAIYFVNGSLVITKKTWDILSSAFSTGARNAKRIIADLAKYFTDRYGEMLHAADLAFSWIPGIGPALKRADASFKAWQESADGTVGKVASAIQSVVNALESIPGAASNASSAIANISGGGVPQLTHHAAGGFTSGGWSLVGERGPELVRFPAGSQVYPSGQSAGMLGGMTINVYVPPTVNPKEAGRQVAQLILAHTKSGGRLYPQGVKPA